MPRAQKQSEESHHGILATVEKQYLAALRYSRDEINKRIAAIEGLASETSPVAKTKTPSPAMSEVKSEGKSSGKKTPRNYALLKEKITKPMTLDEILKALDMKPKQHGTVRQIFTKYSGLFKSDGKRPATYTLDTSR